MSPDEIRTGLGIDSHRFVEGRPLVLGGRSIPHTHGLDGHSDADVLAHAVTDAVLGAAGMDDIGHHFPDTDPRFEGADSIALLAAVLQDVAAAGLRVSHVDATVMMERPKLAPHRAAIRERLADVLGLPLDRCNLKATTGERMGFVGRAEGVAAMAIATLVPAAG